MSTEKISFKKVIDYVNWQIYVVLDKDFDIPKKYRYVYYDEEVVIEDSDKWLMDLFSMNHGFIFVKPKTLIPKFPNIIKTKNKIRIFSTNLNNVFCENKGKTVCLKFYPSDFANPKFNSEQYFTFTDDEFKNIDLNDLVSKFLKTQTNNSVKDWYNYILNNCPDIHYCNVISVDCFNKDLTKNNINIDYHFRTTNELNFLLKLENYFLNQNIKITIYDDISKKYNIVKEYCKRENITFDEGIINGIKFIKLRYSEFNKIKEIKSTVLDFLC